jgi:hypothetical protein
MTTEIYAILLSIAGTIIVILLGIIISASNSRFKNVDDLLSKVENIQTLLSERNTFCLTRHERIERKLKDYSITLAKHSEDITTLKTKIS